MHILTDNAALAALLADLKQMPDCGPNLEYDAEFLALERRVQAEPPRYVGGGGDPGGAAPLA